MDITSIKETGTNNLLRFSIANNADIKSDTQLQSLINDETCYLLTLENVNFLELFRLTQRYREKLKILDEYKADIPPRSEMLKLFNGEFIPDPEHKPDEKVKFYEIAEYSIKTFLDLALQMSADDDIIRPDVARLFLPMLSRRLSVQIPISFMDIVVGCQTPEECKRIFNSDYPATLEREIIDSEESNVRNMLYLSLMKATSIIRYDKHYDDLLRMTKYFPLKNSKSNKLYKFAILDFFKYDNISRGEIRCSMFKPNKEQMAADMKMMSHLSTPLKVDFVVQLPIQYMELILNSYSATDLQVSYEASMSSIIEGGITFDDFKAYDYDEEDSEDEEVQAKIAEYNNSVSAYRTRIDEANQIMLNAMPIMLQSDSDIDITSVFALMPSIYTTKAVFTINTEPDSIARLTNHIDSNISAMMLEMVEMSRDLLRDINKNK